MNFIDDYRKQIMKLHWNLANSVSNCDVGDVKFRVMDLLKKEMIFWTVDFGQAVSVSINLVGDWTFWGFGVSGEVWVWLHLSFEGN
jgi:hypothetical protein